MAASEITSVGTITAMSLGVAGGVIGEFMKWYKNKETLHKKIPDYAKSKIYWLLVLIMVILGGLLVGLHILNGTVFGAFLAFNVGFTAPIVLSDATKLMSVKPGKIN